MMTTIKPVTIIAVLLLLLSACATTRRTDLYFGLNIPGGGQVSKEQWQWFSDSVVALRFPEGYTERDATGKWRDTQLHTTITEQTKVLTFIGKKSRQRQAHLDTLMQVYMQRYQQQAVLRMDVKGRMWLEALRGNEALRH
ncbi:DUF3574 domain-containing protein [Paraflavitalea devenefica]|uniref:DUF3574 domain-containing protein n=1 Tax=Paraflavitalea devenefica TaxID=2716334 RepID=UPI001FE5BE1F|nr:DUF3574 domain-containing protein [Paraflavitalea devenefica]